MDNSSVNDGAITSMMGAFVLVYVLVIIAVLAFSIWVYWRILSKAGYNGALALLMLIPLGGLVPLLMLAFGRWPIEDQLAALQGGHPLPAPTVNPYAGPPATQ